MAIPLITMGMQLVGYLSRNEVRALLVEVHGVIKDFTVMRNL